MATFNTARPPQLVLTAYEQRVRAQNSKGDGPVPYVPIPAPTPAIYTHIGHAINYGRGRRNGRTIRLLILHTTEGGDNFTSNMAYEAHRAETVSATAFVGPEGQVGYDTPEADRPWTTGRWNDESLTAEIMGRAAWSPSQWRARPKQMEAVTRLLADWCLRHYIPVDWLSPDQIAEGASRQSTSPVQGTVRGICDHRLANDAAIILGGDPFKYSHTDIGPGLRTVVLEDILPEVARRLAPPPTPPPFKERIMSGIAMGPPVTSPDRVHRPLADKVTGPVAVRAINPQHPDSFGAVGVDVVVEAKGVEGDGWITCNGITVASLRDGENTLATLPPMPVDALGYLELVVNNSRCNLIVDRANHRLPA